MISDLITIILKDYGIKQINFYYNKVITTDVTWLIKMREGIGAKSTMSVRDFNLRDSQV
jgi:hypothetical protein